MARARKQNDNRRLVAAIAISLVAHAALLLSVGAPAASGSGSAGGSMQVVLGPTADISPPVEKPVEPVDGKRDADAKDNPRPAPVEVDKAETRTPDPVPVETKKPEPRQAETKPIRVSKLEPPRRSSRTVEVRKPDPPKPAPKQVDAMKPAPTKPAPKKVEVKKVEPPKTAPKKVEVKKVEPTKAAPKKVEVKKVKPRPKPKAVAKAAPKRVRPKRRVERKPVARRKAAQTRQAAARQAPKRHKDPGATKAKQMAAVRPGNDGTADAGRGLGGGAVPVLRNPRFGRRPSPAHYPRLSVQREEEGTVIVRALVHRRGTPSQVRVHRSSGYPRLDHAALQAVRRWVFLPMQRGGRAVTAWVEIPVRFRLQ